MDIKKLCELKERTKFETVKSFLEAFWEAGERCDIIAYVEINGISDPSIEVPMDFVTDGFIQLNMRAGSLKNFSYDEEKFAISFTAGFRGKDYFCSIPVRCIGHILDESNEAVYPLPLAWFLETTDKGYEPQEEEEILTGGNVVRFPNTRKQ